MKHAAPLLFAAAVLVSSAAAETYNITPFLNCIDYNAAANSITAYFGYESTEQAIIQVNVGNDNRFIPNPAGQGQPTLFLPGLFERAFRVTLDGSSITQWIFLGIPVTISKDSKPCPSSLLPLQKLPAAAVGVPYSQQLAAVGGLANPTWSIAAALPAGLTLSTAGLLQGIPQAAGNYQVSVQATDGSSTDTRTYLLSVGGGTTINDAISTRPPGFTPQFRTVTNVASTASATASCNTNEFVVTGGGACTVPNSNTIQGRIATNQPTANGWTISCSGGTATAVVVCQSK
jgi:hypothetical protein